LKRIEPKRVRVDFLVAGAGIAGLSAARTLADEGAEFLVLDEYPFLGGQYLRHREGYRPEDTRTRRSGFELLDWAAGREEFWTSSLIIGCYGDEGEKEVAVSREGEVVVIRPGKIIIATGARERYLPFPGWTLPGVLSVGAVQALIKTSGVLPGKEGIFAGTGPFLLAAAHEFREAGGKVLGIFELNPPGRLLPFLPDLLEWEKLREGTRYLLSLLGRIKFGWRAVRAEAKGEKVEVTLKKGNKRRKSTADFLAIGYGFSPNTELAQLCGCPVEYCPELGGFVVKTAEDLSCAPGIYASGEVTGIGGARKSMIEGRLAALSALGKRDPGLLKARERELSFARRLNTVFSVPLHLWREIPDETIICRCEDVRMGEIRRAVEEGFSLIRELKEATRVTMGNCQGRTCFPIITEYLRALGRRPEPMSVRPPLKPVEMGIFVREWNGLKIGHIGEGLPERGV